MGTGKSAKKPDEGKLQWRRHACVRRSEKYRKTCPPCLRALGELAIPNPNFRHSQLSSLLAERALFLIYPAKLAGKDDGDIIFHSDETHLSLAEEVGHP